MELTNALATGTGLPRILYSQHIGTTWDSRYLQFHGFHLRIKRYWLLNCRFRELQEVFLHASLYRLPRPPGGSKK